MQIKIMYFASLRDNTQKSQELIETESQTVAELFEELNKIYNFSIEKKHLKAAVNEEYKDFNYQLKNQDTVVFIPPVAGG